MPSPPRNRRVQPRTRRAPRKRIRARATKPIWQQILDIVSRVPEADLHKLPTDLAAHHDHYLSGQAHS
jgi:hypothetical protein